jgi:PPK2 family polyphosphate:nucleotide phosphotransferase
MRAEAKHSLLIVFQGMDASGKDGSVDKLYRGLYPMATSVHAFKSPNDYESSKDYLWRVHNVVPSKGEVGIFNRSHYEDILVPTVHNLLPEKVIDKRYGHINDFEEMLEDNNTHVVKFYLHISKEEQTARFKERTTSLEKKWKYNSNDLSESKLWDKYMDVYENLFSNATVKWTIVPADDKWYRDYLVAKHLVEIMEKLKMKYPNKIK